MNSIIKRVGAFTMGLAVSVSLMGGALAYTTPDFTDVPVGNWAYESVMKMADAGIIKGRNATTFSPEMKVSPAMWLTLVGRAVYEADVTAAALAGDEWFTAYVRVAQAKGLTTGTNITDANLQGEMTRYDMAVTTYAAIKLLGAKDATVDTATIKDYGDIPQKYLAAVGQMYATGLIKGDSAGSFNGTNTMRRDEAATVMSRLIDYKAKLETPPAEPEKPAETIPPRTGETKTFDFTGEAYRMEWLTFFPAVGANVKLLFKDGRVLAETTADQNGKFSTTVTVDAADYSYTADWYLIEVRWTDENGVKWSNMRTGGTPNTHNLATEELAKWSVRLFNDDYYDLDF